MQIPPEVEKRILNVLGFPDLSWHTVSKYKKRLTEIRKHLHKLTDIFTQDKSVEDKYSDAYIAFNFPMNLVKTMLVMNEIKYLFPESITHKDSLVILDVGCGEGAGMFGLYYALKGTKQVTLKGIDISTKMLKQCQDMAQSLYVNDVDLQISLQKKDVSCGLLKKVRMYDIVIFANSLTEIITGNSIPVKFIERIFKSVTDDGLLIIIEPALKQLSRRVMALRAEILHRKKGYIILPCFHTNECPLYDIRKQREWCHQSITWNPPDYMKILNQRLNREIDKLKFSYLVITKKNLYKTLNNTYLVVSSLLKEKGKTKCYLCTPMGRIELVRLSRFEKQSNSEFDKIKKGDFIALKNCLQKKSDTWQITKDTQIKIIYSKN